MCDVFLYANPTLAPFLLPTPFGSLEEKKVKTTTNKPRGFLLFLVVGGVVFLRSALGWCACMCPAQSGWCKPAGPLPRCLLVCLTADPFCRINPSLFVSFSVMKLKGCIWSEHRCDWFTEWPLNLRSCFIYRQCCCMHCTAECNYCSGFTSVTPSVSTSHFQTNT